MPGHLKNPDLFPPSRILPLDGLRGISILGVVLFHAVAKEAVPPWLFPLLDGDGYVRIFFVISGFIITLLLLRERELTGSIQWPRFILLRATKLVPPLFVYLLAVYLISLFVPSRCKGHAYLTSALFLSELIKPACWNLGHTWSLSVEELYYLAWTPFLAYASKRTRYFVILVAIVIAPTVRGLNHLDGPKIPLLPFIDSLAWGALAAILAQYYAGRPLMSRRRFYFLLCGLIVAAYVANLPFSKIPSLRMLRYLAPLGPLVSGIAGLVILLRCTTGVQRSSTFLRLLCLPPLLYLGRISYSLYLAQQFVTRPRFLFPAASTFNDLLQVTISIAAGTTLYFLVERPLTPWLRRKLGISGTPLRLDKPPFPATKEAA